MKGKGWLTKFKIRRIKEKLTNSIFSKQAIAFVPGSWAEDNLTGIMRGTMADKMYIDETYHKPKIEGRPAMVTGKWTVDLPIAKYDPRAFRSFRLTPPIVPIERVRYYRWNLIHHNYTEEMFKRARYEIKNKIRTDLEQWEDFKNRIAVVEYYPSFSQLRKKEKEIHYVFSIKGIPDDKK